MKIANSPVSALSIVLPLGVLLGLVFSAPWLSGNKGTEAAASAKHKGAHFYGRIDTNTDLQLLARNNIEWVTLIAWSSQVDYDGSFVGHHDGDSANTYHRGRASSPP